MSFTDHKITAFAHKVSDLPDEPQIPAADLKSRFDACPEELRQSLNAVCDDAARLEARVEGIVVDTFGDTIDKEMLSDELAAELDGKAVETSVASRFTAEQTAREAADDALSGVLAQKCEIFLGSYVGTGAKDEPRFINLGFTPKAVLLFNDNGETVNSNSLYSYGGLFFADHPLRQIAASITENGFLVQNGNSSYTDQQGTVFHFLAFK